MSTTSDVAGDVAVVLPAESAGPSFGKSVLVGSTIAFVIVFTVAAGVSLWGGFSVIDAIGLGVFAGLWGGPGFGGMLGAIAHYVRTEEGATAPRTVSQPQAKGTEGTTVLGGGSQERMAA